MPRHLGTTDNLLIFDDPICGDKIGLRYRLPTTSERQGYANMAVQRGKKGNVTFHHAEARLKYGGLILTGVREGDFLRPDGSTLLNDDANWKEMVLAEAPDLVMALAAQVFDGGPTVADTDDEAMGTATGE